MSAEATGWTFKHSPYTGDALVLHIAIADVVNDLHDNQLWMATDALATKARCSVRTVQRALKTMCDDGWLELVKRGGGRGNPTTYRFVFKESLTNCHPLSEAERVTSTTGKGDIHDIRTMPLTQENPITPPPSSATPKTRDRNPVWDALVLVFGWEPKTDAEAKRVGKVDRELRKAHPDKTPEQIAAEIPRRAGRYRSQWPNAELTPEAFLKHWSRFAATTTTQHRNESLEQLYG